MFTRRASLWMLVVIVIVGMISGMAQAQDNELSPEATVEALYTQYLGYFNQDVDEPTFPDEGWYRNYDLLTADFVAAVDAFDAPYDPFLCAQNIPTAFAVDEAVIADDGAEASVVVRTNFANYHAFEVALVQQDGAWLVNDVLCDTVERDPVGLVKNFYLVYLSYNDWDGEGEPPNFVVDGTYRVIDFLTNEYVAEIDAMVLDPNNPLPADPLICAQDVPERIDVVDADIDKDQAVVEVETSFANHRFAVELVLVDEEWRISGVTCHID